MAEQPHHRRRCRIIGAVCGWCVLATVFFALHHRSFDTDSRPDVTDYSPVLGDRRPQTTADSLWAVSRADIALAAASPPGAYITDVLSDAAATSHGCSVRGRVASCRGEARGVAKLEMRILVIRPASHRGRCQTTVSNAEDDAVEVRVWSSVARPVVYGMRRVVTWSENVSVAVYAARLDVYEAGRYSMWAASRFFCGTQLDTWNRPHSSDKLSVPAHTAWTEPWARAGLSASFALRWASPECTVDSSLYNESTEPVLGLSQLHIDVQGRPPTLPLCTTNASTVRGGAPGRWVNARRLAQDQSLRHCPEHLCVGPFHELLYQGDVFASNRTSWEQGWVFVPSGCRLFFPTGPEAWSNFDRRVIVLLGDSTTSDTLYHLLRVVFRSSSSPPRNRWSDPFEMKATAPFSGASFVVRQNRVGNMERDRESGWFDSLRGLQFFKAPYQIGKALRWIGEGRSVVGKQIPAVSLSVSDARLVVDGHKTPRRSDVRGSGGSSLDGFPDVVIVHSGPHDRRHPGHTRTAFLGDAQHACSLFDALLAYPRVRDGGRIGAVLPTTRLIWRTNVVGAGPYYRCSRLENPWIYRAMDSVMATLQEENGRHAWTTIDAASVTEPFHWEMSWSDGIHYGRYMTRYAKMTTVDRVMAVLLWNEMHRLLS